MITSSFFKNKMSLNDLQVGKLEKQENDVYNT